MRKFAWLPTKVSSGKTVWFSHYWYYQSPYDDSTGRPPLFGQYFTFSETDQEKVWRLLKENIVANRNVWNNVELTQEDRYA